jgi:hypothetical protein
LLFNKITASENVTPKAPAMAKNFLMAPRCGDMVDFSQKGDINSDRLQDDKIAGLQPQR